MPNCDFNKVALTWVFSCIFAIYFQNTFSQEHPWMAASVRIILKLKLYQKQPFKANRVLSGF